MGKCAERTKLDFWYLICRSAIVQLFDLRSQSSTGVPFLLLNQPNMDRRRGPWRFSERIHSDLLLVKVNGKGQGPYIFTSTLVTQNGTH